MAIDGITRYSKALAFCVLLPVSALAGEGEQYIDAYNGLVRMLADRCVVVGYPTNGLEYKDVTSSNSAVSSVTQTDLNQLRAVVVPLLDDYYVVQTNDFDPMANDVATAFPLGRRTEEGELLEPSLMKGIGAKGQFTRVPAEYTSDHVADCTNDFTDAPLLWVHFDELYRAITAMRYTAKQGTWQGILTGGTYFGFTFSPGADPGPSWNYAMNLAADDWGESAGIESTNAPCAYYRGSAFLVWIWAQCSATVERGAAVNRIENIGTQFLHTVHFYAFATESWPNCRCEWDNNEDAVWPNRWRRWDSEGPAMSGDVTSSLLGSTNDMPIECEEPTWEAPNQFRGYYVTDSMGIVEWTGVFTTNIVNPAQDDPNDDGLIDTSGCECRECGYGAKPTWGRVRGATCNVKWPLGVSSDLTNSGVRVKAYINEYKVNSQPRQMFSLDTRIVSTNSGEKWGFATVKRPSGAEVTFPLQGTSAGKPVNLETKKAYELIATNGAYELRFHSKVGGIVHGFAANGDLAEVRIVGKGEAEGSPTNWPGMTIARNDDRIVKVVCPDGTAEPVYDDDLITDVNYRGKDGRLVSRNEIRPGSRIFRHLDADSNLVDQVRLIATNGSTELWHYGDNTNRVAKKEIRTESFDPATFITTVTEIRILNPGEANEQSNITVRAIQKFAWGDEIVSETVGYGSAAAQTTIYSYCADPEDTDNYGHLKLVECPDGSWTAYTYDSQGREIEVWTPFGDTPPTDDGDECRILRYYYAGPENAAMLLDFGLPEDDIALANDPRPRMEVEEVRGICVSRTYHAYLSDCFVTARCLESPYYEDAEEQVVTYMITTGMFKGRPSKTEHPDGTLTVYDYSYDDGTEELTITVETGEPNGSGDDITDGTRTITLEDAGGHILSSKTQDILSGIVTSDIRYTRDALGRNTCVSNRIDGSFSTTQYGCCGPEVMTDTEGIQTVQDYNELKQIFASTRLGITTFYEYDVDGQVVKTTVAANGGDPIVRSAAYDQVGRLVAATNELGHVTSYSYSTNASGAKVVSMTSPDGSTRVETYCRDGQLASVTGTAVHATCFAYGVDSDGRFTTEYRGSSTNAPEWTRTHQDLLGRTMKTVLPPSDSGQAGYTNVVTYNSLGQQVSSSDGFTTSLTAYNDKGEAFQSAVDMNGNGVIDINGTDRISESETSYGSFGTKYVRTTISRVYPTNGSSATLTLDTRHSSLDGSESWSASFGRTNHVQITRDRAMASRTETLTRPDGTQTISVYSNGLVRSVTEKDSVGGTVSTRSMSYDAFNRLQTATEPAANGEARTATMQYNPSGVLTSVTATAGALSQTTAYEMDSMGRRVKTVLPDGGVVNYGYSIYGELTSQNGARTYPVGYSYTDQGRLSTMSTYRNGTNGSADMTTWTYDPHRGWLTSKVYADNSVVNYEYTAAGLLDKRTWARGVETIYGYDNAGSLTNVTYSDSTPGISYLLDRLGRAIRVTDGLGTHTSVFNPDGSLSSVAEVLDLGTWTLQYSRDTLGRMTNTSLLDQSSAVCHLSSCSFDSAGRISTVGDRTRTATYGYGATSGSTWTNLSFGSALNVRRAFDGLNRLSEVFSRFSESSVVSSSYSYNQANQRTSSTLGDGSYWVYQYDPLGQVTSGKKYFADGSPVQGVQFEYNFDTIGNRTSSMEGGAPATPCSYAANDLNQYAERTVSGCVLVAGEAGTNVAVSVRMGTNAAVSADRHGEYFWKSVDVGNSAGLFSTTNLRITATMPSGTNSLVWSEARSVVVPKTPEVFVYDLDGNLLMDGLWTNTWDANNRLVSMESLAAVPDNRKKRLAFRYDYMGRRTVKQSESGYSGGTYSTTGVTTYVWDGWNLIAEVTCPSTGSGQTSTNVYVWGLDLSGSLQGAGGVGGLLSAQLNNPATSNMTTVFYCYDGNGNVMGLVNAADGSLVAEYAYSPVGALLECDGPLAKTNPFRFSTKPTDDETGVVSFQNRDYRPDIAKWLSNDPMGEVGGFNRSSFARNDPVNHIDFLGFYLVAFDGTGNNMNTDTPDTNVERLYKGYSGAAKYYPGVGSRWWSSILGGYSGLGGDARIDNAWRDLVKHYQNMSDAEMAADPVDIIGFSRGAALARYFANVIYKRGDPRKYHAALRIPEDTGRWRTVQKERIEGCPLPIRFLGIFDTVASFGDPGNRIDIGYDFSIPSNVQNVRHATARDEGRDLFPLIRIREDPTSIEKMFPGVHSDVGGGYADNLDIQFGPLLWMWQEGVSSGVPWNKPAELEGWTQSTGKLKGHQSNVPPIRFWLHVIPVGLADHPQAEWDSVAAEDQIQRPDSWVQ